MDNIRRNDYVYISKLEKYGRVVCVDEYPDETEEYSVVTHESIFMDEEEIEYLSRNEIELAPTKNITIEEAKAFFSLELTREELLGGKIYNIGYPEGFDITLEDMCVAIKKAIANKMTYYDFNMWYVNEARRITGYSDNNYDASEIPGIPNNQTVRNRALFELNGAMYGYTEEGEVTYQTILDDVETYLSNRDKPLLNREFTDNQKRFFVEYWKPDKMQDYLPDDGKILMKRFIEYFCEKDDPDMLETKGYMCYGKCSKVYDEDWFASRDCFLKLMEISPSMFYANTLGYIYYYGRCNNGVPEYDKAFYYFSIGAAGGVFESMYKQADMFMHGYGVPKDYEIAKQILYPLYDQNLRYFVDGEYTCKFADIALRIGSVDEQEDDSRYAYRHYLEAHCAIKLRQVVCDMYGDSVVAQNVQKSIDRMKKYFEDNDAELYDELYEILLNNRVANRTFIMEVKSLGNNEYIFTVRFKKHDDEEFAPKLFVVSIVHGYAGMLDEAIIKVKNCTLCEEISKGETRTFEFDVIAADGLLLNDDYVLRIDDGKFDLQLSNLEDEKEYMLAAVSFGDECKEYEYICDIDVKIGDLVLVPTPDEEKEVYVRKILFRKPSELPLPMNRYKKVIRKVK